MTPAQLKLPCLNQASTLPWFRICFPAQPVSWQQQQQQRLVLQQSDRECSCHHLLVPSICQSNSPSAGGVDLLRQMSPLNGPAEPSSRRLPYSTLAASRTTCAASERATQFWYRQTHRRWPSTLNNLPDRVYTGATC